jgi:diacylglycerol kinase family enzyme
MARPHSTACRLWALASLLLLAGAAGLAIVTAAIRFPRGFVVAVLLLLAAAGAWEGIRRRGAMRTALIAVGVLLLAGALAVIIFEGNLLLDVIVLIALVASLGAARMAYRVHVHLPHAAPPQHPVLFYNPKSGGGKAEKFHLPEEAARRGIKPIELRLGDDLEQLVRDAVRDGADGLAMAGGDGSQAIVAMVASETNLPYACIPSGTRNHFALDLGVDREDVVGALDAFVDGGERLVDLAEVNGRVFVNNVSLGLYAQAVQSAGYRNAKLRTLLNTVPEVLGPDAPTPEVTWEGEHGPESGAALLVSNNRYRLGSMLASGTRPALDQGVLGIAVIGPRNGNPANPAQAQRPGLGMEQWTAPSFEVRSSSPVPAGIDGEATTLDPPLEFRMRRGALRVRIAHSHPGASPSALTPDTTWGTISTLARLVVARG